MLCHPVIHTIFFTVYCPQRFVSFQQHYVIWSILQIKYRSLQCRITKKETKIPTLPVQKHLLLLPHLGTKSKNWSAISIAEIIRAQNNPTGERELNPNKNGIVYMGLNHYAHDESRNSMS